MLSDPRLSLDKMPRVRKIDRDPKGSKNYFLVDACFLVNKYIPKELAPVGIQRDRIEKCLEWWEEIDKQLDNNKARVYIPDICIAETFKTLAKKFFDKNDKWFKNPSQLDAARKRFRKDIVTNIRTMRSSKRIIKYHDISTSRDIIISVDRFFKAFLKRGFHVHLPDLILLASAKYLMDFYDISRDHLHIITLDSNLWGGSKKISEIPNAYDPTKDQDRSEKIFE